MRLLIVCLINSHKERREGQRSLSYLEKPSRCIRRWQRYSRAYLILPRRFPNNESIHWVIHNLSTLLLIDRLRNRPAAALVWIPTQAWTNALLRCKRGKSIKQCQKVSRVSVDKPPR